MRAAASTHTCPELKHDLLHLTLLVDWWHSAAALISMISNIHVDTAPLT